MPSGSSSSGSEPIAEDITVQVFDLHLEGPLKIVGRVTDSCAGDFVLIVQGADVSHADPYPHAGLALIISGQEDRALVAANAGEFVAGTPAQLETEGVYVIRDAGIDVVDAEDRRRGSEGVAGWFRHRASKQVGYMANQGLDEQGCPRHHECVGRREVSRGRNSLRGRAAL